MLFWCIVFIYVTEIEAVEACSWLHQAGFPQYVQLFEDNKFPVDLQAVETDHSFLDDQLLQSLFRWDLLPIVCQ